MKRLLVVVDMQNDFIDGALGTNEAVAIVPAVEKKIAEWDGDIVCTLDTHSDDYLATSEGKSVFDGCHLNEVKISSWLDTISSKSRKRENRMDSHFVLSLLFIASFAFV